MVYGSSLQEQTKQGLPAGVSSAPVTAWCPACPGPLSEGEGQCGRAPVAFLTSKEGAGEASSALGWGWRLLLSWPSSLGRGKVGNKNLLGEISNNGRKVTPPINTCSLGPCVLSAPPVS